MLVCGHEAATSAARARLVDGGIAKGVCEVDEFGMAYLRPAHRPARTISRFQAVESGTARRQTVKVGSQPTLGETRLSRCKTWCRGRDAPVVGMPEPRSWLKNPSLFGRDADVLWRDDDKTRTVTGAMGLRAAQIHHDVAVIVRSEMRAKGLRTWEDLRAETGIEVSDRTLGEIIRGEGPLSLRQIAALETAFGPLLIAGARARRLDEMERRALAERERRRQGLPPTIGR